MEDGQEGGVGEVE